MLIDVDPGRVDLPTAVDAHDRAPIAIADLAASDLSELRSALDAHRAEFERRHASAIGAIEVAEASRSMPSLFPEVAA